MVSDPFRARARETPFFTVASTVRRFFAETLRKFAPRAAVRFAKESGRRQTIVTVLCDSGHKYQSTLFNREWLASNHLDPNLPLESILGR
jgi:hypothetical protein